MKSPNETITAGNFWELVCTSSEVYDKQIYITSLDMNGQEFDLSEKDKTEYTNNHSNYTLSYIAIDIL
jgi:hypothetical protein